MQDCGRPRQGHMRRRTAKLAELLLGMRAAFERGENVMQWARQCLGSDQNDLTATHIAYDLQAGTYVHHARESPQFSSRWCAQLAELLRPYIQHSDTIMEAGCGEATTLNGVAAMLSPLGGQFLGFDISWSRIAVGLQWLMANNMQGRLFVADLFNIPLAESSVDVVYTAHSVEPNGGRAFQALSELFRVARKALVLVEPIYELAKLDAQERMRAMAYVEGLREAAGRLPGRIRDYRLLDVTSNPLNPSGVLIVEKTGNATRSGSLVWQCPVTQTQLIEEPDLFFSPSSGLAYPILRKVPLLLECHAVLASRLDVQLHMRDGIDAVASGSNLDGTGSNTDGGLYSEHLK